MDRAVKKAGYHYDTKYWMALVDYYRLPWWKRIFKRSPIVH